MTTSTRTSLKEVGINIGDIVENTESDISLMDGVFNLERC